MTMTDPIADMLTRIRNANTAFHDEVAMPHSRLKSNIAEILKQEGYIAGFKVVDAPEGQVGRVLMIDLKYGSTRSPPVCPESWAASARRSSRRRPGCSPTGRPPSVE